jgi:2-polyprenyl-3-methyl-5-hydroxy-6-metoxy-1,4-benzoquinol methylase
MSSLVQTRHFSITKLIDFFNFPLTKVTSFHTIVVHLSVILHVNYARVLVTHTHIYISTLIFLWQSNINYTWFSLFYFVTDHTSNPINVVNNNSCIAFSPMERDRLLLLIAKRKGEINWESEMMFKQMLW